MIEYRKIEDDKVDFYVKKELYPLNAIYKTSYLFTDDYYIGLDMNDENYIIKFSAKNGQTSRDDIGKFQNELLNQSLKIMVSAETKEIRELIVTRALYSAFIPEEELNHEIEESNDYNLEEIAKAWYEE